MRHNKEPLYIEPPMRVEKPMCDHSVIEDDHSLSQMRPEPPKSHWLFTLFGALCVIVAMVMMVRGFLS